MSAVAGWYTDPGGTAGQLRWWDGQRWTEHVTADPTATADEPATETFDEQPPAGTIDEPDAGTIDEPAAWGGGATTSPPPPPAAEDILTPATVGTPAWGSGASAQGSQPPPPPGAPGNAPAWGSAGSAWGGATQAPSWEPVPRSSGNGVRTGLIIAAVVGVVLVGLVGAVFLGVVRSAGQFDVAVSTEEGFGDFGGEITSGGELTDGGRVRADVPDGGTLELELVVVESGPVLVDVRGLGGFDAVAELADDSGEILAHNDDRPSDGGGGGHLDPLLDVDLDPGTYQVRVRGFAGESGSVDVHRS